MTAQQTNKMELIDELKKIPLFTALDDMQLKRIVDRASIVEIQAGNTLFRRGQHAEHFYYLKQGQIRLYLESEEGHEKIIDVVHPGQLFAEAVTFLSGQVYPVNANAMQTSTLLSVSIPVFRSILRESIDTCFRLLAELSQRLHVQLIEIDNLTLHNATYRLAYHLLKSIPEKSPVDTQITLDYPKNVLASRLSIKPETLSRILLQLKQDDVIDVRGNQIILHDVAALRKYLGDE